MPDVPWKGSNSVYHDPRMTHLGYMLIPFPKLDGKTAQIFKSAD